MEEMRSGAYEHFLQRQFDDGLLPILDDNTDLRGISIYNENITFPESDNFKGTDFSYSSWSHSRLDNGVFMCSFHWSKFAHCEFHNCIFICPGFAFAYILNCKFIGCDFITGVRFLNCDIESSVFLDCHFTEPAFIDCRFDAGTEFGDIRLSGAIGTSHKTDLKDLTRIYAGIRSAYAAGQVFRNTRKYLFLERHSATRHNIHSRREKASELFWELLAGYGVRPIRVFRAMLIVFLGSGLLYAWTLGLGHGMRLAAGSYFTFGAGADILPSLPIFLQILYVVTAFLGVSLTALLVTVLANMYMRVS